MDLEFCEIEATVAVDSVFKTAKRLGDLERLGRELHENFGMRAVAFKIAE